MALGYQKFLGKKKVKWFKPVRKRYKKGNLEIAINPELRLTWDGQKYLIKLYLKSDTLSKDRLATILGLMKNTISPKEVKFALLDVRNGKLFLHEPIMDQLMPLVEGEAESLEVIINRI